MWLNPEHEEKIRRALIEEKGNSPWGHIETLLGAIERLREERNNWESIASIRQEKLEKAYSDLNRVRYIQDELEVLGYGEVLVTPESCFEKNPSE